MYQIYIKLRNVLTGKENIYPASPKYKSKGKATRDIAKFIEMEVSSGISPVTRITASVVKVKQ